MIAYTCACGHKGKAEAGMPKFCPDCGAGVTLGGVAAAKEVRLTLNYVKKAVLRYVGQGEDAPLLTPRQKQDRFRELRYQLEKFKVNRVANLKEGDLAKFMGALGLH